MDAHVDLITPAEAAALLGRTIHRVRQLYGPDHRLTKYENAVTGAVRLSLAEVQALKAEMDTYVARSA